MATTRHPARLLNRRALLALGGGLTAGALAGPRSPARAQAPAGRPVILISTPIFADLLHHVVGDAATVQSVIPDGADPHTYEATAADLAAVSGAAAFIEMGAHLEPFVEAGAWRRAVADAGIAHLVLADHLPLIERDLVIDHGDHVHDLRAGDPHVWLDPALVMLIIDQLAAFSQELLPDAREAIAANATAYQATLATLDEQLQASLDAIPDERRKLVVFHDAFAYFAERYDFTVVGVVLPNPEGETSAQHLAELVALIQSEAVPVIFTEPQFDRRLVDQVAAEAGVGVGELLTDTFAGRVASYVELMEFNAASLIAHLAG